MSGTVQVLVKRLDRDLALPVRAHPGDAGFDLFAAREVVIAPGGGRATVPSGLAIALPAGWVGLVHPRSGLAANHGITVLNAPGTVDAGYRGEVKVTLLNTDPVRPFHVQRGDRIAQIVFQRFGEAQLIEVERLPGSIRGGDGFGSTGRGALGSAQPRQAGVLGSEE